jgi:hypothetical protein
MQKEKRMTNRMVAPISGEFTVLNLSAAITMLGPALQTVIEKLATMRTEGDLAWFDELEKELLLEAKNTISEGVSIEAEVEGLKFGVDLLQATLDCCRDNLRLNYRE